MTHVLVLVEFLIFHYYLVVLFTIILPRWRYCGYFFNLFIYDCGRRGLIDWSLISKHGSTCRLDKSKSVQTKTVKKAKLKISKFQERLLSEVALDSSSDNLRVNGIAWIALFSNFVVHSRGGWNVKNKYWFDYTASEWTVRGYLFFLSECLSNFKGWSNIYLCSFYENTKEVDWVIIFRIERRSAWLFLWALCNHLRGRW